ncbi:MAG: hypothetical protein EBZ48_06510, partial [Proteobacteria bacterium]|nr:hypothetical protein [Pseudomonadota bacterium]
TGGANVRARRRVLAKAASVFASHRPASKIVEVGMVAGRRDGGLSLPVGLIRFFAARSRLIQDFPEELGS